jgi:hypothetical protein
LECDAEAELARDAVRSGLARFANHRVASTVARTWSTWNGWFAWLHGAAEAVTR